jgi:hypothetical protein
MKNVGQDCAGLRANHSTDTETQCRSVLGPRALAM